MKKVFFTALCCLGAMVANADEYTDANGVTWTYTCDSTLTISIIAATDLGENVVCPDVITHNEVEYPVTSVGMTFDSNTTIKTVELPDGLTSIERRAFYNCSNLTSITIPESVVNIGREAFYGCSNLTSITIPKSVTSIEVKAFQSCSSLTDVYIEDLAAWCNLNASSHPLVNSNMKLFLNGELITELEIPEGITNIRNFAFRSCSSLTSVTVPKGVMSIGKSAFSGCTGLTSFTIPEGVISIGDYTFRACSGLTSITIPESVTSIGIGAFYKCYNLTSVTIPEGVTNIESETFRSCYSLTSIHIPEEVISVGDYAFSECNGLTSIAIPESVTSIGNYAFNDCDSLTSITIPESVVNIGSDAFWNCFNLTNVYIEDLAAWCNLNASSHPLGNSNMKLFLKGELITKLEIPEGVKNIRKGAFFGCSSLTSVTIPEGVTSIETEAFSGCSGLTSIIIPKSVTSIKEEAFLGCSGLTSITIPEGVTSVKHRTFAGCSSLTSVTIPEGVTSIDSYAFYKCFSLASITIPKSVTSIEYLAFTDCVSLNLVKMEGTTPPSLSSLSNEVIVFVVPDQTAYESYCAHTDWEELVTQLTYEDAATRTVTLEANEEVSALYTAIGEDKLKFVHDLTIKGTINGADIYMIRNKMPALRKLDLSQARIVSGGGVYYQSYTTEDDVLGDYAFYDLNLSEVTLPEQLTSIGIHAFYKNNLRSIGIPEKVTSIELGAFSNCSTLKDVVFPKTLKSIGNSAFMGCGKISRIVLPIGLETIGQQAFSSCSSLKEVRFPSGLNSLGSHAFQSCDAITDVYAYTIEPVNMIEETFSGSVVQNATLHYPLTSKYNYYTNGGWGQFLNMEEFDEPYEYFYLNNDYTLNTDNGGVIDGTPDVDINAGGGLIVEDDLTGEEDKNTQHSNDMNIHHNGGHGGDGVSGSLIANGNFHANKLHFHINVTAGKWHFFAFPFNVKLENIKCEGNSDWVFYYYDGAERAANGKGGWKKVTYTEEDDYYLKAGMGYIFQSSKDDVLVITVDEDDDATEAGIRVQKDNKKNTLEAHTCENEQDASWNFTGNPHLSYYDLDADTYDAPITVWDGDKYVAVRPGDDDYQLAPFQAFFVQKPEGVEQIEFKGDNLLTHNQKENKATTPQTYARTRSMDGRLIVNVTLTGGSHSDYTRVVFNNAQKINYEMACDAAKFITADVPQLYTLDNRKVKYAINERPQENGSVPMGYSVPVYGSYVMDAPRMDTPMMLKDLQAGIIHDFNEGNYEFVSEAGTFDNRFVLMTRAAATGMEVATLGDIKVAAAEGAIEVSQLNGAVLNVFTTGGEKVLTSRTDGVIPVVAGIYVVEADGKSVKVVVK